MTLPRSTLIKEFLHIGTVGFGGPPATMGMMYRKFVEERALLSHEEVSDGIALCQALPGPGATQLAIYIGYRLNNMLTGILCGIAFLFPSFLLITFISWVYFSAGLDPQQVTKALYGVQATVIGIIAAAVISMAKNSVTDGVQIFILIASLAVILLFGVMDVVVLLVAAILGVILYSKKNYQAIDWKKVFQKNRLTAFEPASLSSLFWLLLKAGALIYGGGLVIIPLLYNDVVNNYHWLSSSQFLDGVAFGQMTPGPVAISATFFGYAVGGFAGAAVATVAIFLPCFLFIAITAPLLARVREVNVWQHAMRGAMPAVVAMMAAATMGIAPKALVDIPAIILASVACILLVWKRVNSTVVVIAGGIVGAVIQFLFHY